jgi:hypothetical protein
MLARMNPDGFHLGIDKLSDIDKVVFPLHRTAEEPEIRHFVGRQAGFG